MSKVVDTNSFWLIKHNPISKVGVFPYMGRSISDECEPNKVYYVYRSADTLSQSVPTWDNPPKPFIDDHEMLGEGFSKIDDRPVQGVISNPVFENDTLYADISVYSESLKDKIANGKKELSLGYFCKYRKEKGVYKGQAYDYVQEDMVGNHIALVDNGRCGSDVKVFDHKCTMDSLDISNEAIRELKTKPENDIITTTTETKDSEMADKREYIKKIMAIAGKPDTDFKGGEEEKIKTIAKLLETSEYSKSEDEDEEIEEEKVAKDKCGKDEEIEEKSEKEEKKESEDEDEEAEEEKKETEDEEVSPADVMAFLKMILEEVRSLNGKKTTDEEEIKEKEEKAEDEDEKAEDEEAEEEKKEVKDSAKDLTITFAKDGADEPKGFMDDPALRKYLHI